MSKNSKQATLNSFFTPKTKSSAQSNNAGSSFKTPSVPTMSSSVKSVVTPRTVMLNSEEENTYRMDNLSSTGKQSSFSTPKQPALKRKFDEPQSTPCIASSPAVSASTAKKMRQEDEKYKWLDDKKDSQGRRPDDELYDASTIHVPEKFYRNCTPFERQYWKIKSEHFDTILFFQKGKFYELFENDADIGAQLFNLKLTQRGVMRMVGVPQNSFDYWATKFIESGYKVSRVDQMETSLGKQIKDRDGVQEKEDIVRRELTCVLIQGTLVDSSMIKDDLSNFCLAIKEQNGQYGLVLLDASTNDLHFCHLDDLSVLETLLAQCKPKEILFGKNNLSPKVVKLIKSSLPNNVQMTPLIMYEQFYDAVKAVDEIARHEYSQSLAKCSQNELVLSSLGAIIYYLQSLNLDQQVLTQCSVTQYDPLQFQQSLIIDGQSLLNLEIFQTTDGQAAGSLFSLLNKCSTPFGKRLFQQWLCHPLFDIGKINDRLDAIDDLSQLNCVGTVQKVLGKLPDLERLITRVHSKSIKLKDFVKVIDGFCAIHNLFNGQLLEAADSWQSSLKTLVQQVPLSSLKTSLDQVTLSFDINAARQKDEFLLIAGINEQFDSIVQRVDDQLTLLNQYLKQQQKLLGSSELRFKDIGKELFQIEVPSSLLRKVPEMWSKRSGTKQCSRFYTPELIKLVDHYNELVERKSLLLADLYKDTLGLFDNQYDLYKQVVRAVAVLDAHLSLALVSKIDGGILGNCCRPEFLTDCDAFIRVQNMSHPCVAATSDKPFITNNLQLGGDKQNMILLTGANMGGKSTMLRQTCLLVIMAQLGCYVPATKCEMTLFDRVFTRIGANDNIIAGQSTFMVELAETSRILKHATSNSLVILDELGRGTGTMDGYSIAFAVLAYLVESSRCLGLFSTHYALLTKDYVGHQNVRCMHMQTLVPDQQIDDNGDDECGGELKRRDIVFLYKLIDGASASSHGLDVALMAGIPQQLVLNAKKKSDGMLGQIGWIGNVGVNVNDVQNHNTEPTGENNRLSTLLQRQKIRSLFKSITSSNKQQ
ncbi:hypothetical protein MP228_012230 [Amoeboaphelidium protococcarum]|nr:hypothetical protein MP228_012230 [Amoeboaphelidium protococcarum]